VIKTLILVLIAGMLGGTGHVLLAKGMKTIGDITEAPTAKLGGMVVLQASFFFLYLTLLSRADVSQVLPMTAFDYIVVALLAQLFLAEPVTPARWTGIGFIVLGVFLVSRA
jgi:uncharacterized membrane protein